MIDGNRIYLRYLTLRDSDFIHKIVNREESRKYVGEEISFSLPETKKWIREKTKQRKMGLRYDFVIINKKNKERIGTIDIFNINKKHKNGTLGLMWIEKDYRNKILERNLKNKPAYEGYYKKLLREGKLPEELILEEYREEEE